MATTLQDVTVVGVTSQTQPASANNHLLRMGEARQLLNLQFQGVWNADTVYSAQQGVNWQGSFYVSNVDNNEGNQPDTSPSQWRLAAQGGQSAYIYVAYADDADGTGFTTTFTPSKNFVAFLATTSLITAPQSSDFTGLWVNYRGQSFLYVAYASDANGSNFSLTPANGLNYIAVLASPTAIANPAAANFTGLWMLCGAPILYVAYADDAEGTGFTLTFDESKDFIAIFVSATPIAALQASDFAGLWKNYSSQSYIYVGYASDANGTNFSLTPSPNLTYVAWLASNTPISPLQASNFAGLWVNYQGPQGNPGQSAYVYIAYANDSNGTGFTTAYDPTKNFIAIVSGTTPIASPQAANFAGLWKQYGSSLGVSGPLTLTNGILGVNASSNATANTLVQCDANGNFSANTFSATSVVIGGSATLSISSGALSINQSVFVNGLTVNGLTGILQATSGAVSGNATTGNLPEGGSNLYFTSARVLATQLAGISSTNILLATDTVLSAFGKIDNALGASSGTVTGNLSVTGNLTVSGNTTLKTSVNGILQATNGVISGSATTDNIPQGVTNLYFTTSGVTSVITSLKGAANGIAPLDSNSKVPLANLYAYGATPYGAASQTAMLSLSAAKQGDFCLRSDQNIVYVLQNNTPSVQANWIAWLYPVASVNGATGTVVLNTDSVGEGAANLYFTNARATACITSMLGAANGICPLNANSLIPSNYLPPVGNSVWIVNSQAAQTNLSSALKGDLALRTDESLTYILSNNTPSSFSSWTPLLYPVACVNGLTGAVVLVTDNVAEGSNNLYFTNVRSIGSLLTGFSATGGGVVAATDTILTALEKHEYRLNYFSIPTVRDNTTSSFNSSVGNNGDYFFNQGALYVKSGGAYTQIIGVCLPLTAGNSYKLTGTLYFNDGLSDAMNFGGNWTMSTGSSDAEFWIKYNNNAVIKVTNNTAGESSLIVNNGGITSNGNIVISNGQLNLNTNRFLYLNGSANALDFGGNFGIYTQNNFTELDLLYNGSTILKVDTASNVTVSNNFTAGNINTTGVYRINGTQVVGSQQNYFSTPSFSGNYGSDYGGIQNWMSNVEGLLKNHGLMASS
ncbi:MAG TPA: hypothetical protein VGY56_17430 [Verrucomicrobiae bacterium]|nr:hypothetical protein [Verrucomicrobiae bacterium]